MRRSQIVAWEQRWARPVAAAALLAVAALIVSMVLAAQIGGEGEAEVLRSAHEHSTDATIAGIVNAIAFLLLAAPLLYLFRVVDARAERMRSGMIVLLAAASLLLAASSGLAIVAKENAVDSFLAGEAKSTLTKPEAAKECAATLKDKGAKDFADEYPPVARETARQVCEREEIEDDEASNAASEASPTALATLLGLTGALCLIVGLFYTALWAMRTGVLSRFWAAFGMALGITVLLGIVLFLLVWLAYVGLLIGGWVPGGRPPAWAAGEAVPWPTPGEKAAAELESRGEEEPSPSPDERPEDETEPR